MYTCLSISDKSFALICCKLCQDCVTSLHHESSVSAGYHICVLCAVCHYCRAITATYPAKQSWILKCCSCCRTGLFSRAKAAVDWVKKNLGKAAAGALVCAAAVGAGVLVHKAASRASSKQARGGFERPVSRPSKKGTPPI